jgi:hypothetical protein
MPNPITQIATNDQMSMSAVALLRLLVFSGPTIAFLVKSILTVAPSPRQQNAARAVRNFDILAPQLPMM